MMHETSETRDKQAVYKLIADNYAQQGMFQQAYEYHRLHSIQKDSLIALERTKELEEIKTRYELEGKIKENETLIFQNSQKERELLAQKDLIQLQYTIGILIIIFLMISLFLAFRLYHVRQKLTNANKSKDKLFGIIAHDLKGPIGNIGAMLKLMQVERNEKRIAQYFDYLSKSVQNLSTLTSQLLSWTFSHKGDFNFKIENINVREISDRTLELFEYQLTEKRIMIINSIENDLFVRADENAFLTIFRNIVSNAIKFTNKKGQIILEATKQNNFIEIKIRDNGLGMTENAIRKVLKGKHVVSISGTENEKGSGLGFSIVIEFVKKMKGKIDIQSDGESGTTVILTLRKASPRIGS
jgi:signal transduction histidine kinase